SGLLLIAAPLPYHTLSLHDALPIFRPLPSLSILEGKSSWLSTSVSSIRRVPAPREQRSLASTSPTLTTLPRSRRPTTSTLRRKRSEEHTSELQSRDNLVCRLLLDKQ